MTQEIDKSKTEEKGFYKGLEYEIVAMPWGSRCGYVTIPDGYGLPIEEFYGGDLIDVHGGITYQKGNVIGFDCAHYGDGKDADIISPAWRSIYEKNTFCVPGEESRKVWTREDVRNECYHIIDQLQEMINKSIKEK